MRQLVTTFRDATTRNNNPCLGFPTWIEPGTATALSLFGFWHRAHTVLDSLRTRAELSSLSAKRRRHAAQGRYW